MQLATNILKALPPSICRTGGCHIMQRPHKTLGSRLEKNVCGGLTPWNQKRGWYSTARANLEFGAEGRGGEGCGGGGLTPMFGEGGRDGESILYGGCHMTIKKVYLSVGLTWSLFLLSTIILTLTIILQDENNPLTVFFLRFEGWQRENYKTLAVLSPEKDHCHPHHIEDRSHHTLSLN